MNMAADGEKLRREHIGRCRRAKFKIALGSTSAILMVLAFAGSGYCLCFILYVQWLFRDGIPFRNPSAPPLWIYMLASLLITVGCAILAWHSGKTCKHGMIEAKSLAGLAPEFVDTLPAEEVLVRSSEEPPIAQRAVLLRAATGPEAPNEELGRASEE